MSTAEGSESVKAADSGTNDVKDVRPKLSPRDQEILMASWLCIKGQDPQVDYEKLARTLHLKNAHTANTIFYNVKKKIKAYQSQSGEQDVPQSVPATPKKTSRKRVNSHAREPSTSGKGVKRMKTAPKLLIEEEDHGSV